MTQMTSAAAAATLGTDQQAATVRGVVVDVNNEPIIGASILVQGTTIGVTTDGNGRFALEAAVGSTLRVSYVGYITAEVKTTARDMRIILQEDTGLLEEVLVVGYGTIKKSDVTGSVVSVNADEMMKRNPLTLGAGLQGAAAGVSVVRNSGDPEGGVTIRIRGVATVNNSADPLYVVDGVQVGTSAEFVNPNDVESIEILKDASATAIYGSQGANGVILITTKRGSKGKAKLSFSANFGVQTLANKLDMANAEQFVKGVRRASASDGTTMSNGAWVNYDKELNSIDWQKEMSQTALQQNYNLSLSGGSENMQAMVSVGYLNNEGIVIESNFKRLTARANVNYNIQNFIRTGVNIAYVHNERYGGGNLLNYATIIPTMDDVDENGKLINVPIQWPDGTWGHFKKEGNGDTNKGQDNPVAAARTADSRNYFNRLVASAFIDIDLLKGLTFKTVASANYNSGGSHGYTAVNKRTYLNQDRPDSFNINLWEGLGLNLEAYFTYNLKFATHHNLTLMGGYSISRYKPMDVNASTSDFPASSIRRIDLTKNSANTSAGGGLGRESRGESFFGRLNYSFLDRYLLTATIRRDGSSNFGAGNRYATFPSASLAWRASEEQFIKDLGLFSNLKVRLGWGQTGNAGNSTNLSVDQLSSNRIAYYFYHNAASAIAPGLAQTREIDTNLKWETNEQTNIGLDLGFFNNELNVSLDYFIRDAKDLLLYRSIRPSTGYVNIYTNAGHIRNSGFEFAASYQKQFKDWGYSVKLNGATLKNKAVEVGDDIYSSAGVADGDYWTNYSLTQNGQPVGAFYGWRVDGIFQSQAEIDALNSKVPADQNSGFYQSASTQPGDYKYRDVDGNGYIDDNDREVLGHGYPTLNYGLSLSGNYKSWDFNVYMYGVMGQKILSYAYKNLTNMYIADGGYRNVLADCVNNAWTPENPSNKYPRLTKTDANHNGQVSDAYLKSGNFLKIQSIQVGYTFPEQWLKPVRIESLRAFVGVENPFTITGYKAGDPEVGNSNVLQTGFDGGRYPYPRTFSFGLSVRL
jgi:TonB-linked SusC/RagA family outer membrane protein